MNIFSGGKEKIASLEKCREHLNKMLNDSVELLKAEIAKRKDAQSAIDKLKERLGRLEGELVSSRQTYSDMDNRINEAGIQIGLVAKDIFQHGINLDNLSGDIKAESDLKTDHIQDEIADISTRIDDIEKIVQFMAMKEDIDTLAEKHQELEKMFEEKVSELKLFTARQVDAVKNDFIKQLAEFKTSEAELQKRREVVELEIKPIASSNREFAVLSQIRDNLNKK